MKHGEWHRHRWSEIDTSELRSETDHQLYLLSTLPLAVIKEWDVYKHTVEMVQVVQTTAPMVEGLRRLGRLFSLSLSLSLSFIFLSLFLPLSLRFSPSPPSLSLSPPLPPASTSNETIMFFISSSPSMRARHWKQVLRFAKGGSVHLLGRGGTFDPSILEELTFGQLLDMGLHSESYNKI